MKYFKSRLVTSDAPEADVSAKNIASLSVSNLSKK